MVALRKQLEAITGSPLDWQPRPVPEMLETGVPGLGLPRGALTEICGPASSGRTALLLSLMARVTAGEEFAALVDASDAFDPHSAAAAGVNLERLLWVRCGGDAEKALKATDLLVQGGGFGLVAMDLGDLAPRTARRISLTSWFRLRRAVEHTPTVLAAVEREPLARTCASMVLSLRRGKANWTGAPGCSQILRGFTVEVRHAKPMGRELSYVCQHPCA